MGYAAVRRSYAHRTTVGYRLWKQRLGGGLALWGGVHPLLSVIIIVVILETRRKGNNQVQCRGEEGGEDLVSRREDKGNGG